MGKVVIIKDADFSSVAVAVDSFGIRIQGVASPEDGGVINGSGNYEEGDVVTLTAVANEGYLFHSWSDGVLTASRQVTVGSTSATYTAIFSVNRDIDVDTTLAYTSKILITTSDEVGNNIESCLTSVSSQFNIYVADVLYNGSTYEITFRDQLANSTAADHYKWFAICDSSRNVIAYILKSQTGTGERTIDVDMSLYPNARYLYVSTTNVINVVVKAAQQ